MKRFNKAGKLFNRRRDITQAQSFNARSGRAFTAMKQQVSFGKPTTELKVYDIGATTYQVNTTGSITPLFIPVLGTDYTNRIGRKTLMKWIYIRGRVQTEASATAAVNLAVPAQQIRFMLVQDMQPNAAAPVIGDILVTASPSSQLNLNNRDRFRILSDKEFVFDPYLYNTAATVAYSSASRQIYNFKKFKKLNLETIFNSTNGGTIADITSGALYMVWVGSQAAGTDTDANAFLTTRIRFNDA